MPCAALCSYAWCSAMPGLSRHTRWQEWHSILLDDTSAIPLCNTRTMCRQLLRRYKEHKASGAFEPFRPRNTRERVWQA
jgi:hypothetical protein